MYFPLNWIPSVSLAIYSPTTLESIAIVELIIQNIDEKTWKAKALMKASRVIGVESEKRHKQVSSRKLGICANASET